MNEFMFIISFPLTRGGKNTPTCPGTVYDEQRSLKRNKRKLPYRYFNEGRKKMFFTISTIDRVAIMDLNLSSVSIVNEIANRRCIVMIKVYPSFKVYPSWAGPNLT